MKKAIFTLTILVMAFGNWGFAQSKADLKAKTTEMIFKQYGLVRDSYFVPQKADFLEADGTQHRTTYYYDESDYTLTEEITETFWDSWQNETRIAYEYDFNSNVLEMLCQEWDGDGWEDAMFVSYDYDSDGINEVVYQYYIDGSWVNFMKEDYTYYGDQWTVLYWTWNGTNWSSDELYTYTRDATTIELLIQYMEGGAWQNEAMEIYSLDFDENIVEIQYKEWDAEDVLWADVEKTTYIYDGGVYTDQYVKSWDGATWNDEYHFAFDYDGIGNAKNGVCFAYDGNDWVPADGDIDMAYDYNAGTKSFYGSKVEMICVDLTNVDEKAQTANLKVYPVPAEDEIFIHAEGFQRAEIYSLTGQKLMESTMEKMNVSSLSQGVYLLKVYDQSGETETRQIVVK